MDPKRAKRLIANRQVKLSLCCSTRAMLFVPCTAHLSIVTSHLETASVSDQSFGLAQRCGHCIKCPPDF